MNNNNLLYCLPSRFKAEFTEDNHKFFETIRNTWNKRSPITLISIRTKNPLVIQFTGFSETDSRLLFKVIDGAQPLSEYFDNKCIVFSVTYNQKTEAHITLRNPTLIQEKGR